MLPGGSRTICVIWDVFYGLGLYYTDPPQHLIAAGYDLDYLSVDDIFVDFPSIQRVHTWASVAPVSSTWSRNLFLVHIMSHFPPPGPSSCRYLHLLRVATCVQQLSVVPLDRVCFSSSGLAGLCGRLYSASFQNCYVSSVLYFCSCFLLWCVLLCSRTQYVGISLALIINMLLFLVLFFFLTVCDHRISTWVSL